MIKNYFSLTKPGIVFGNLIVGIAGYLFGSPAAFAWMPFGLMIGGLSCIIGSACTFNNIFDKDIDARMERTKGRTLPSGRLSAAQAGSFGAALFVLGVGLLALVNYLALAAALVGFGVYVFFYTPLKHKSATALFVGAVAGATPPVVGYAAATNTLDSYALGLFLFLFVWQLWHFLAIARYRFEEYRAAGVPLFVRSSPSEAQRTRALRLFFSSLVVLLMFCIAISAAHFL